MANHNQLGKEGELLAVDWLQEKGFSILHRNWRYSYYEADIIATKDNVLHFMEIKTRSTQTFGDPEEDVTKKKIRNLMDACEEYQYQNPSWKRVQYNILCITIRPGKTNEYFFIEDVYL